MAIRFSEPRGPLLTENPQSLSGDDGNDLEVFPVEPDGGIGDGAGPIPLFPIAIEGEGGIGDGAMPLSDVLSSINNWAASDGFLTILPYPFDPEGGDVTILPFPFEPDGGIGDGAGPLPLDPDAPIPVEPDGGIGDGAGPIPGEELPVDPDSGTDNGTTDGTDPDTPIPVEPDGGIGDGAGPPIGIPENNILGGGIGTKGNDFFYASEDDDTFTFLENHGNDTVTGFDLERDTLDLSGTDFDFTDVESLSARTTELQGSDGSVMAVLIDTGNGNDIYIHGVSTSDFANMNIDF